MCVSFLLKEPSIWFVSVVEVSLSPKSVTGMIGSLFDVVLKLFYKVVYCIHMIINVDFVSSTEACAPIVPMKERFSKYQNGEMLGR